MSGLTTIFASLILLIFLAVFIYLFIQSIRSYQLLKKLQIQSMRELGTGTVAVKGVIGSTQENLTQSPLTNKNCYWYEYSVEQKIKNPSSGISITINTSSGDTQQKQSSWQKLRSGRYDNYFFLNDGAHEILVLTAGGDITTSPHMWITDEKPNIPALTDGEEKFIATMKPILNKLAMQSYSYHDDSANMSYRLSENTLQAGENVIVIGFHQQLSTNDIETLLQDLDKNKKFFTRGPNKKELLLTLQQIFKRKNNGSLSVISALSSKRQTLIISSLPESALKKSYWQNIIWLFLANLLIVTLAVIFIYERL